MTVPGITEQALFAMRGEEWSHQATLPLSLGNITGSYLAMTIKRKTDVDKPGDATRLAKIDTAGLGGVVIDDALHATFTIPKAVMARMPPGEHQFDVEAKLTPSGRTVTAIRGPFTVDGDVTRD